MSDIEEEISESEEEIDDQIDEVEDETESMEIPVDVSKPIRDENHEEIIIIKPENRRTSNILQQYELAAILSARAVQLADGAQPFIDVSKLEGVIDEKQMAIEEIMQKKCPIIVRRKIGDGDGKKYVEDWKISELTIPNISKFK